MLHVSQNNLVWSVDEEYIKIKCATDPWFINLNTIKIIFWIKKGLSLPFTRLKVAICGDKSA